MSTAANAVIPGVVAMSAREVKALRDRIADLEGALRASAMAADSALEDSKESGRATLRLIVVKVNATLA